MTEVKWVKLATSFFDDEKINYIESLPEAESILLIWIRLITLSGKCNAGGWVFVTENIPYTEAVLALKARKSETTVKLALEVFTRLGMIERTEKGIFLCNWEKHQSVEKLDLIAEQNRKRQQKYRDKKKAQELLPAVGNCQNGTQNYDVTRNVTNNSQRNSDVTPGNALDIDIDIEIDINNIYSIFEHWNGCKIVQHRNLDDKTKRAIKAALKTHGNDVERAITNYSLILQSDDYIWTHKWTLREFLQRGLDKFLDWETCSQNYRADKWSKAQQPAQPKNYQGIDFEKFREN